MSLKRNISANYVSQIYVAFIGIVMVPLYVGYMGLEAYGLVGFFAMLQAWFQLLDLGLTPTMSRETARFRGGAVDGNSLRALLRALEWVFAGVGVVGSVALIAASGMIAHQWLKVETLPLAQVQTSIALMSLIIALRWLGGLYRGAVNGFEQVVWLSGFNMAVATARFVLVIPFFIVVGTTPVEFFSYQLVLAVIELLVLVHKTYRLFPPKDAQGTRQFDKARLRSVLKFSLSIAVTGSIWVFVTQTDKLLLSSLLSLSQYSQFTLAVLIASGVTVISGPISGPLLPRLTRLAAEHDEAGLVLLYRQATRFVGAVALPTALVLAFFPQQVLLAWTGDPGIAREAAVVLRLYALGNGVLALAAFPYYLQFAKGDLKLHLIGNLVFVVVLIPSLVFAASRYGMNGAGYVWMCSNILYLLAWVPLVHRRLARGLHQTWLIKDIGAAVLAPALGGFFVYLTLGWSQNRVVLMAQVAAVSLAMLLLSLSSIPQVRQRISGKLRLAA